MDVGYYELTITDGKDTKTCKVPSNSNDVHILEHKAIKAFNIKNKAKWGLKHFKFLYWLGTTVERPLVNDTQNGKDVE